MSGSDFGVGGQRFEAGGIPLYVQIANFIRNKIDRRELDSGDRLPPEPELATVFGVSRVPVRQALAVLEAEGLVSRAPRRGTHVSHNLHRPKSIELSAASFEIEWSNTRNEMLPIENGVIPERVKNMFSAVGIRDLTQLRRRRMVGTEPFCVITTYLPGDVASRIADRDFENMTMIDILTQKLGLTIGRIHKTLQSRIADAFVAQTLSISTIDPVMHAEVIAYDENENPLHMSEMYYRGDKYSYTISMK